MNLVKKKIASIKKIKRLKSFYNPYSKKVLNQNDVRIALSNLHKDYVLTPTDKAAQNVAITCKSFYIKTLLKEVMTGSTYEIIHDNLNTILLRHETEIKKFGFEFRNQQKRLPSLMWNPKMHKHPSKQRFIATSFSCTTKIVSQTITSCLKLIQTACQFYCKKIQSFTGWNYMWIIKNSQEVFNKLKGKIQP